MKRKTTIILAVLLVLGFSLACVGSKGTSRQDQDSSIMDRQERDDREAAYKASQAEVKKELFAPDTAKFPPIDHHEVIIIKISDGQYRLGAFVESEDESGTMTRTNYNFEVSLTDDGYRVESLEFFSSWSEEQ